MATLRGFAKNPAIPTFKDIYGLNALALAVYPMYRGLARLVGMDIGDAGSTLNDQVEALAKAWNDYDFFFLHFKYTDSTGEDGNFPGKVEMIERLDNIIPKIRAETRCFPRDRRPQHPKQTQGALFGTRCPPFFKRPLAEPTGSASLASPSVSPGIGPIRGQVPHEPGHGPRGPIGQIRRLSPNPNEQGA